MKNVMINKKGILTLLLIFCLMLVLNSITPMFNEDYFTAFVWPEGLPNLGRLPENSKKITTFTEVLENARVYYFIEGGRVPGCIIRTFFSWIGKEYFNPLNSLMLIVLVMEIYWLQQEGKVSFDFSPSSLLWAFFSLWAFNLAFADTCLWMSGSCDYLWMLVITFAFLIPYVRNYYEEKSYINDNFKRSVRMFIFGLLAGCSNETTICWIILVLYYWLNKCKKNHTLQNWKVFGFVGLCVGYALLVFAPGNFARLTFQQKAKSALTFSELYAFKFSEIVFIVFFHFLLWYFILSFFCRYKNKIEQTKLISPYIKIAIVFSIIALGSGILMFLIPASVLRPSFLNLAFLTVAAASLFRAQEVIKESVIPQNAKTFLKLIGSSYLIFTVIISLWCNFINWNQWNEVLAMIQQEQKRPTSIVLKVNPYHTDNTVWSRFARGFHLLPMPVVNGDENDRINVTLAHYYGIKGIVISQKNIQ